MLSKRIGACGQEARAVNGAVPPRLEITKVGVVSRDYRHRYKNGYRDFSFVLPDVLALLDEDGCDGVLFSLFSIVPRKSYEPCASFKKLLSIKAVFLEEFRDGTKRQGERYIVYYRTREGWKEYEFHQQFGTLANMKDNFVSEELPKRTLGNCNVLLCGETNAVKYSPKDKKVHDSFGLRKAIPKSASIILNPIHDRMTRFEMRLKRQFLSENDRWVVSVWNKGKTDKNGRIKDGRKSPWTIFHNGEEVDVSRIDNKLGVDIGILEIEGA
jgi:hypothetical protein